MLRRNRTKLFSIIIAIAALAGFACMLASCNTVDCKTLSADYCAKCVQKCGKSGVGVEDLCLVTSGQINDKWCTNFYDSYPCCRFK